MDFDERAEGWDDDPTKVRRSAAVAAAIRETLDLRDRPDALEVGAGTGLLSRQLADTLGRVTLSDASGGMVDVATRRIEELGLAGWTAVRVDPGATTLPGGPYGLVLSLLALHHIVDVPAVLGAAHDALGEDGRIAVSDLDEDPDGAFHAEHPDFDGHHGFDRDRVRSMLLEAGFVDVDLRTATTIVRDIDGAERTFPLFLATGRKGPGRTS